MSEDKIEIIQSRLPCKFTRIGDELVLLFEDGKELRLHPREWAAENFGVPVTHTATFEIPGPARITIPRGIEITIKPK
jgi:hypothetical protein